MKIFYLIIALLVVVMVGGAVYYSLPKSIPPPAGGAEGVLKGKVTIGPICPVERIPPDPRCTAPPEAYTSREVIVYLRNGQIYQRKHFNPDGTYLFKLSAGDYVLDIPRAGVGGSKDLPYRFSIRAGEAIVFNFSIDTGIR
jgi:hypothetical protein